MKEKVSPTDSWPTAIEVEPFEESINTAVLSPDDKAILWQYLLEEHPAYASNLKELAASPVVSKLFGMGGVGFDIPVKLLSSELKAQLIKSKASLTM